MKFKSLSLFVLLSLVVVGGFFLKADIASASCGMTQAIHPNLSFIISPTGTYSDPTTINVNILGERSLFCGFFNPHENSGDGVLYRLTYVGYTITNSNGTTMYSGGQGNTLFGNIGNVDVSSWPAGTYTITANVENTGPNPAVGDPNCQIAGSHSCSQYPEFYGVMFNGGEGYFDTAGNPLDPLPISQNFTITRPVPMSGTLTPASSTCTIGGAESSCNQTLSWTTTSPVGTSSVTNNGGATPSAPTGNNSSAIFTVPFTGNIGDTSSTTTFYLYNNSQELKTATVTTTCTAGTVWDGYGCEAPVLPSATLTVFNATIPVGASNVLGTYKCRVSNAPNGYEVTATNNNRSITTSLCNNTNRTTAVNYGSTTFYVYTPGVIDPLAQATMTVGCDSGSTWNESESICAVTPTAVNGICSATHYNCSAGTSANNVENTYEWGWSCNGSGGGTTAQCSETIPPPTSITASCPAPGTSASISWTLPAGYSNSYFRIRDITAGGGDIWEYRIPESVSQTGTSTSVPTTSGHQYEAWVHTRISPTSYSQSISRVFSCTSDPYGSIEPSYSEFTIPNDQSTSTTGTITWSTTNPLAGVISAVTSATCTPGSASGNSGSRTFTCGYGDNWLSLYHNGQQLGLSARVVGVCSPGSDYVNGVCRAKRTITTSAGGNCTITPSGTASVIYNSSGHSYTIGATSNPPYQVSDVLVNGVSVGAIGSYLFNNVTVNKTISATCIPTICQNGATNPPTCTICVPGSVIDENGQCALVTVSVTADTPYNTTPNTNINFTYNPTTNSGSTECRLLDNNQQPLPSSQSPMPWRSGNSIAYPSPNNVPGPFTYYVQCRNTTTTSATGISNPITVNTACTSGNTWNGSSCVANPTPTGTLSASTCILTNGAQTCNSTVTWSTQNLTAGTTEVTRTNTPPGPNISYATSGTTTSPIRRNQTTTFYLYHNIGGVPTILDQVSVSPVELPSNPSPLITISDVTPDPADTSIYVTGIGVGGSTQDEYPLGCPGGQMPTLPATAHVLELSKYKINSGPLNSFDMITTQTGENQPPACVPLGTESSYRPFLHSFSFPIDTTSLPNGIHTITVYADTQVDSGQNTQVSDSYSFNVQHPVTYRQCNVGVGGVGNRTIYADPGTSRSESWAWEFVPIIENEGGGTVFFTVTPVSTPSPITTTYQPASAPGYTNRWDFNVASNASGIYYLNVTAEVQATGYSGTLDCGMMTVISEQPPMSGTLTPALSSCTIASGQSSCTKTLSWTTTNPVAVSAVTNNGTATPSAPSGNNSSASFTIPYKISTNGSTNFYLYNNAQQLALATVNTVCASGSTWNGTICAVDPSPSGTLGATNCTIAIGASSCNSTVSWTTANLTAGATEITGNNNASPSPYTPSPLAAGSHTFSIKSGTTTFFLYHNISGTPTLLTQTNGSAGVATCAVGSTWNGTICVGEAPSGTITSTNCTIAIGASSCSASVSWTTANLTANPTAITRNSGTPNSFTPSPLASGSQSVTLGYGINGTTTFYLYHNSALLDQTDAGTAVATCAVGSTWNGTICVGDTLPSGTLSASPCTIANGASTCTTTLTVTTANLVSPNASNTAITRNPAGVCTNCTYAFTSPVTAVVSYTATNFFLYHNAVELATASLTPGIHVNCLPGSGWDGDSCEPIVGMSGTLSGSNCSINEGENSCTTTLSWGITNPEGSTTAITANGMEDITVSPVGKTTLTSGTADVTVPFNSRTFYLYNNAKSLVPFPPNGLGVTISANCEAGTVWNGFSQCVSGVNPINGICATPPDGGSYTTAPLGPLCSSGTANPSALSGVGDWSWVCEGSDGGSNASCNAYQAPEGCASMSALPVTIFTGGSTKLTWSSCATSCSGTNFDTGGEANNERGVSVSPAVSTTYAISCDDKTNSTASINVIVKKKPILIEN